MPIKIGTGSLCDIFTLMRIAKTAKPGINADELRSLRAARSSASIRDLRDARLGRLVKKSLEENVKDNEYLNNLETTCKHICSMLAGMEYFRNVTDAESMASFRLALCWLCGVFPRHYTEACQKGFLPGFSEIMPKLCHLLSWSNVPAVVDDAAMCIKTACYTHLEPRIFICSSLDVLKCIAHHLRQPISLKICNYLMDALAYCFLNSAAHRFACCTPVTGLLEAHLVHWNAVLRLPEFSITMLQEIANFGWAAITEVTCRDEDKALYLPSFDYMTAIWPLVYESLYKMATTTTLEYTPDVDYVLETLLHMIMDIANRGHPGSLLSFRAFDALASILRKPDGVRDPNLIRICYTFDAWLDNGLFAGNEAAIVQLMIPFMTNDEKRIRSSAWHHMGTICPMDKRIVVTAAQRIVGFYVGSLTEDNAILNNCTIVVCAFLDAPAQPAPSLCVKALGYITVHATTSHPDRVCMALATIRKQFKKNPAETKAVLFVLPGFIEAIQMLAYDVTRTNEVKTMADGLLEYLDKHGPKSDDEMEVDSTPVFTGGFVF